MDDSKEQMFRSYAWAYFAYHADQRLKTFNFFLLAAGLLAGAMTTFLKDSGDSRWVCPLGLLLTFLSFIFWKIDRRNRSLVKNAEAAIKHLDSLHDLHRIDGTPHILEIFARDDFQTDTAFKGPIWKRGLSYSKCLGAVFLLFGALGVFFAVGCFLFPPAHRAATAPDSISSASIAIPPQSAPINPHALLPLPASTKVPSLPTTAPILPPPSTDQTPKFDKPSEPCPKP